MRIVDCVVIAAYLVAVFGLGFACRGRKHNVDEYFTARGVFRGPLGTLLIGLSICASFISGLSLIALNSSAYTDGLKVAVFILYPFIVLAFMRGWFLRRYLAADNRHPYDIVESRFGYPVRACLSVMFVLLRVGWMALIIYAPALIIIGALGLHDSWFWPIVLAIGLACTFLTSIGGISSVIVIDAVQFMVILLGLAFIIGTVLVRMHAPLASVWSGLNAQNRLQLFDFSPSLVKPWTFWAVVIGQTTSCLGQFTADQMALQRYLAAGSPAAVNRSFLINVWGSVVSTLLLVSVGLLLFAWYSHHPDPALPRNPDMILPYFAVRELPAGLSGLLVAAFLAATVNTLTSGINSLAGAITNDFLSRLGRKRTVEELYSSGRQLSVAIGLGATLSAGLARSLGTVLTSSNIIMGAVLGPMLAAMVWSASRAPVRPAAVVWGLILGTLASVGASFEVSSFWVAPAGFVVAMLFPWAGLLLAGKRALAAPGQVRSADSFAANEGEK